MTDPVTPAERTLREFAQDPDAFDFVILALGAGDDDDYVQMSPSQNGEIHLEARGPGYSAGRAAGHAEEFSHLGWALGPSGNWELELASDPDSLVRVTTEALAVFGGTLEGVTVQAEAAGPEDLRLPVSVVSNSPEPRLRRRIFFGLIDAPTWFDRVRRH